MGKNTQTINADKQREKKFSKLNDILSSLEKLLEEKIVDLHEVKGFVGDRQNYLYYQDHVWEAQKLASDLSNEQIYE
jgi:hypothetical protein